MAIEMASILASVAPCARRATPPPRVARATRVATTRATATSSSREKARVVVVRGRARRGGEPRERVRARCAITRVGESADDSDDDDANVAEVERNADGSLPPDAIQIPMPKRRAQLTFTCDKCEARSTKMVNPDAYKRGTMFVQCPNCEVWHKIVDNLGMIFEPWNDERHAAKNAADVAGDAVVSPEASSNAPEEDADGVEEDDDAIEKA